MNTVGMRQQLNNGHTTQKGKHTLCDVDGNSLKLSDVKDGMSVKIRAKHVWKNYIGYEYLYTAYGQWGKYLAINIIQF